MGLTLPAGFDTSIQSGEVADVGVFVYGQSLLKSRIVLAGLLGNSIAAISGRDVSVSVEAIPLGETINNPWYERMIPLLVLMAVVLGGIFLMIGAGLTLLIKPNSILELGTNTEVVTTKVS